MIQNGFYKVKQEYIDLIRKVGGIYKDAKDRPIYCCIEDKYIKNLFWAIPTSDLSHRKTDQLTKIAEWCSLPERDIRWAYYYIGHTNRPALYRISNCFPIIDKYIDGIYISKGNHLILETKTDIEIISKKLARILFKESKYPNSFEQHITDIKIKMISELE